MATSTRSGAGARNTLWTNLMERYVNGMDVEDLVFNNTPLLLIMNSIAKRRPLPETLAVRIMESLEDDVDSFSGYDTVNDGPVKGAQAAAFHPAYYSGPLAISLTEQLQLTTEEAISDHISFIGDKQARKISDRLSVDLYRGNFSKSTNIVGLEQMLPDFTHLVSTSGSAATVHTDRILKRYQTRQANGTVYGDITHTAWTPTTPGTYWEGNSAKYFSSGSVVGIDGSTGGPTESQRRLEELYARSSWGNDRPNVLASTPGVYSDYEAGAQHKQQITRTDNLLDANITFDNVKFKSAMWVWDDYAYTNNVYSAATSGGENIYGLNTKYIDFCVDPRVDFSLTDERGNTNQHAVVRHLVWGGQMLTRNPRMHFRFFE